MPDPATGQERDLRPPSPFLSLCSAARIEATIVKSLCFAEQTMQGEFPSKRKNCQQAPESAGSYQGGPGRWHVWVWLPGAVECKLCPGGAATCPRQAAPAEPPGRPRPHASPPQNWMQISGKQGVIWPSRCS